VGAAYIVEDRLYEQDPSWRGQAVIQIDIDADLNMVDDVDRNLGDCLRTQLVSRSGASLLPVDRDSGPGS